MKNYINNLRVEKVTKKTINYSEIINLYLSTFPKHQLAPIWILRFWLLRKNVHFLSFYDDKLFVGFCFFIVERRTIFILYLAINPNIRSKGYGSAILEYIKKTFIPQTVILEIEEVNDKYDDFTIREKRLNFYLRNNFKISEYINQYQNEKYYILFQGKEMDSQLYKKIYCKLSLGTYRPNLLINNNQY